MIVCVCRNISDKNISPQDLKKRLREKDIRCGICLKQSTPKREQDKNDPV